MFVSKCFIIPVRSQVTPRAEVLSRNAFRRLMHSSASPWGGLRADVGTLLIVHFKVLVFPYPWGIFFLQSSQYLAKPSTQLDLKMHFRTLVWFFEQLANTRTMHSDEN